MLSDEWLPRYRLLENFNIKWNGNGNAYDRGDYNSSFALRAVELKTYSNYDHGYKKDVVGVRRLSSVDYLRMMTKNCKILMDLK